MQTFSVDYMPPAFKEGSGVFRKTALTRAIRIDGPFTVMTSEGPLRCEDGYLAVDARGYPYPIAADEFVLIYEEAGGEAAKRNRIRRKVMHRVTRALPEDVRNAQPARLMHAQLQRALTEVLAEELR